MTNKNMKKLSRAQLLEMLLLQTEKSEQLERELEDVKEKLADRKILLGDMGSIAEASLKLSGVFEAAQDAADQYLENAISGYQELENLRIITQEKCDRMLLETEKQCDVMKNECVQKCKLLEKATQERCRKVVQRMKAEMAVRRKI